MCRQSLSSWIVAAGLAKTWSGPPLYTWMGHFTDDGEEMAQITRREYVQVTEHRPWGTFTVLADEEDHKVKRITVRPGQRLSLQRHRHRQEHWYVTRGRAIVTRNGEQIALTAGESVDIGRGDVHRVQNEDAEDLVFIEIQLGDYFGEDDIERLEDDYGRTT